MKSTMSAYSNYITELTALFGQLEQLKREKNHLNIFYNFIAIFEVCFLIY